MKKRQARCDRQQITLTAYRFTNVTFTECRNAGRVMCDLSRDSRKIGNELVWDLQSTSPPPDLISSDVFDVLKASFP